MSYDWKLYRKAKSQQPLKAADLKLLQTQYTIANIIFEGDAVLGFTIQDQNDGVPFEFFRQEDGGYWTFISYGATKDDFTQAKLLIKDIAARLDLKIYDPQISSTPFDAKEYDATNLTSEFSFSHVKNKILGISWKKRRH